MIPEGKGAEKQGASVGHCSVLGCSCRSILGRGEDNGRKRRVTRDLEEEEEAARQLDVWSWERGAVRTACGRARARLAINRSDDGTGGAWELKQLERGPRVRVQAPYRVGVVSCRVVRVESRPGGLALGRAALRGGIP